MNTSRKSANKLKQVTRKNLAECQEHLRRIVGSQPFLQNEGLNNEVPFHICPFDPVITSDMNQAVRQLVNEMNDEENTILEINLYDLAIDILKEEGDWGWNWIIANETKLSKDELKELLQGILDVEKVLVPRIVQEMKHTQFDVMFITGVGEVFPYIRSHNILNNLQRVAKKRPMLFFFPGKYQHSIEGGAGLVLFDLLKDDKYYRAFNILDRAI